MIKEAIDRILELAKPNLVTENGKTYSDKRLMKIERSERAAEITFSTLSSLVEYIKELPTERKDIPYFVHVISPTRVELISGLDEDRERERLVLVNADLPEIPFGRYLGNEDMVIKLQAMFQDDSKGDKALLLQFAGTVTSGSVKSYADDGVTQKATIKTGVASKAEAIVPSPCILRPYRTFIEVEQPESSFIFRMRDDGRNGVESALFEADGGEWKIRACDSIKAYLKDELAGTGVLVVS